MPLVLDLAAGNTPVAAICLVLGFATQAFTYGVGTLSHNEISTTAHLINAAIDIHAERGSTAQVMVRATCRLA